MRRRVNGTEIAYDDHGMGQPLIFLHAFPLNRSMWQRQIVELLKGPGFRLVSLDWRGFGESEINVDVATMDLFADDVAALMDALGMQDAILCALSMGGYAAFAFLRKYPQRVRGLILADTKPHADNEEAKANRESVAQLAETQGVGAIADLQVPKLLADDTRQNRLEVELQVRQMINAATPKGIAAASRGMAQRLDSSDLLATITCPTLVIVGGYDALTPPTLAREYAAKIAGAQLVVIPQAGHLSNLEQPAAFQQAISSFLQASFSSPVER